MKHDFWKWLMKSIRKNLANKTLHIYLFTAIPMWVVVWLSPFLVGVAAFLLWTGFWIFYNLYGYYKEVVEKRRVPNGSV